MTSSSQSSTALVSLNETKPIEYGSAPADNMAALLSALEGTMRDTIQRFAATSGKVTENVRAQESVSNPKLIVALQDLDRLQQEFSALNDVLLQCVERTCGTNKEDVTQRDPLSIITLADLKQRLESRLHRETVLMSASDKEAREEIF